MDTPSFTLFWAIASIILSVYLIYLFCSMAKNIEAIKGAIVDDKSKKLMALSLAGKYEDVKQILIVDFATKVDYEYRTVVGFDDEKYQVHLAELRKKFGVYHVSETILDNEINTLDKYLKFRNA